MTEEGISKASRWWFEKVYETTTFLFLFQDSEHDNFFRSVVYRANE